MKFTIGKKLSIFVAVLLFFMLLIGLFSLNSMQRINKVNNTMGKHLIPERARVDSLNFYVQRTVALENMYILADTPKEKEGIAGQLEWANGGLKDELADLDKRYTSIGEREKFEPVKEAAERYLSMQAQAIASADKGDLKQAKAILKTGQADYGIMDKSLYDLVQKNDKELTASNQDSGKAFENGLLRTAILIVIAIVLSAAAIYLLIRLIARPIVKLRAVASDLAAGKLHQDITIHSNDEIGDLAGSLQEMSANLRKLIGSISEESTGITTFARDFTESAARSAEGSEQISTTMSELAKGSEEQAYSTTQLSEVMRDFSASLSKSGENGQALNEEAMSVTSLTNSGFEQMRETETQMLEINTVVNDAVQKMAELDRNYQKVSNLVLTIQTISEQTNLLALNAAIEAARAGEHGKGFAVVADEVRKLSEQVAKAVVEINQITDLVQSESGSVTQTLEESHQKVEQGSGKIKETSGTFRQIQDSINQMQLNITGMTDQLLAISGQAGDLQSSIESIAAISQESSAGIEETAAVTDESAQSMKQVAQHADGLVELADRLQTSVSRFNL